MALNTTVAIKDREQNEEVKNVFDLLKSGDENIKISKHKEVVLILGNTGAGKSTLTHFLAGNNDHLISKEVNPDLNEFIIEDTNNKVSKKSTIISKTLYPELVFDPETRTAFYDCPGFIDTRSAAHDISATYFVKKVIDFSNKVKLVFVVNHTSVRKGVDRNDFMSLINHATNLIKDIEKFKNSIALVVTKVDNSYVRKGRTWKLVPDKAIIESIIDFLHILKEDINSLATSSTSTAEKNKFYIKALQFIDILLEQDGTAYKRIGLFRRPDESGPLSQIKLLQDGKKILNNMIHKNIFFAQKDPSDFGYSISEGSKNYVNDLGEEINQSISLELSLIGEDIKKYFELEEKHSKDIYKLHEKFESGINIMSKFEATNINEKEFIRETIKSINDLDINIPKENVVSVLNYFSYLKFLSDVSKKSTTNPLLWSQGLSGIVDYLKKSHKWYNFLMNLYDWLSDYAVQQNIVKYSSSANKLMKQCNIDEHDIIEVTRTDLNLLLEKISTSSNEHNIKNAYNTIKDLRVNQIRLGALKRVLSYTLNHGMQISCKQSYKLVIKGDFIKLSDIYWEGQCPEKIRFIEIFAMNKVFINKNIYKTGDKVQLSIIAPTWEVIGERTIALDGKPGDFQGKAGNGYYVEARGDDGRPGLPGGAAGSFIGIAGSVVGGQLHITANGGRGGPGQEGGDGAPGKRGQDPPAPSSSVVTTVFNQWGPEYEWQEKNVNWETRESKDEKVFYAWYYYRAHGTNAKRGGNGGDGGAGGMGGNKGMVNIVDMSNSNKILITNNNGGVGINGRGGEGGRPAENGYTRNADCRINRYVIVAHTSCENQRLVYAGHGQPGSPGREGVNANGRENPERTPEFTKPSLTINSFKNYLIEHLPNSVRESILINFLKKFEFMENVRDLYDTLGLVNELHILENNFHNLDDNISLQSFYESLLTRIHMYSMKPKRTENELQYKKVLNSLYVATLSKLCCSGINAKSYMVLDIPKYFDLVVSDIKSLKTIKNDVAINKHKEEFIRDLDRQIVNANYILKTKALPEIRNIFEEMESNIQLLINETHYMIQETEEEKDIFYKKQQQLERSLLLRMLLGPINMIGEFLGFLGPAVGDIVQVINGVTEISQTLNLGINSPNQQVLEPFLGSLSSILEKAFGNINDGENDNAKLLVTQLFDVGSILLKYTGLGKKDSNELISTYSEIEEIKGGLQKAIDNKIDIDPKSVEDFRKDVSEKLGNHNALLDDKGLAGNDEFKKDLKIIQQFLNITDIPPNTYKNIQSDQMQLQSVGETLKSLKDRKKKLQEFERNIYNIIIPQCKELRYTFKNFKSSLSNKAHYELEITKWGIQKAIKDIKFEIQKLISAFDVGEDLSHCLEKLIEATTYFVNIYDLIDDYKDKAKLAAYIANVSSSAGTSIKITNNELEIAMKELDLIIKSNLVLEEYNKAMEAFIQYVFPFAHLYLDQFSLPPSLLLENGTESLLDVAVQKIEHLQSSIQKSSISINEYDEYLHKDIKFTSKTEHSSPFYVWKNVNNKNTINKLLNGGEVIIKSDVTKGSFKNAVKFNSIGLYFRASNKTIQESLDEDLKDFQINMTHFGNHYFKCGGKYYIIKSDQLKFIYHMMKDEDGKPIDKNMVYEKVKSNDYMLSPYALWSIQLHSKIFNYDSLQKYENEEIDLELEGLGEYLDEDEVNVNVCNKRMEEYYTVDESTSEMNRMPDLIQDAIPEIYVRMQRDVHSPMTNGATNSLKSSLLNSVFTSIFAGLSILKDLNPFNKLTHWTEDLSHKIENDYSPDSLWVNHEEIENEKSPLNDFIDNSSLTSSSNLALWNLILRKYIRKRQEPSYLKASRCKLENDENMSEFSHSIAYSYYSPSNAANGIIAEQYDHEKLSNDIQHLPKSVEYLMDQKFEPNPIITRHNMLYLNCDN